MKKTLMIAVMCLILLLGRILPVPAQTRSGSPANQQEGSVHVTGDIGDFILGVENEDQADFSTADKAYIPIAMTKEGNVLIECITGCGSSAGLLHSNSPVTLIDTFSLFDGSGETQIATTNLGASKAYSVPGTGRLVNICVIVSLGTPFAENMSIIFFDADPSVTIEDTSLTLAASQNITNIISLRGSDFRNNFATTKINCQTIDEHYVAITHVVFASEGLTTYDDEDVEIRVLYRRKS